MTLSPEVPGIDAGPSLKVYDPLYRSKPADRDVNTTDGDVSGPLPGYGNLPLYAKRPSAGWFWDYPLQAAGHPGASLAAQLPSRKLRLLVRVR